MASRFNDKTDMVPANTATRSLVTSSAISLPDWISPGALDADVWCPPAVRAEDADELRALANAHKAANAPASYDERRSILGELRLGTTPRKESADEARASFEKLLSDLSDLPADILRRACKAYVNFVDPDRPGMRFFPRSAAEIRVFSNPMQNQRSRRAYRLRELAEAAADVFDPATRCSSEEARAIMEEFGLRSPERSSSARHNGATPTTPTREALEQIAREMGIAIVPDIPTATAA